MNLLAILIVCLGCSCSHLIPIFIPSYPTFLSCLLARLARMSKLFLVGFEMIVTRRATFRLRTTRNDDKKWMRMKILFTIIELYRFQFSSSSAPLESNGFVDTTEEFSADFSLSRLLLCIRQLFAISRVSFHPIIRITHKFLPDTEPPNERELEPSQCLVCSHNNILCKSHTT